MNPKDLSDGMVGRGRAVTHGMGGAVPTLIVRSGLDRRQWGTIALILMAMWALLIYATSTRSPVIAAVFFAALALVQLPIWLAARRRETFPRADTSRRLEES